MSDSNPVPQFKGIWIPAAIWEHPSLSMHGIILWATIDSFCSPVKDCYCSNEWLAKRLGITERAVQRLIAQLKEIGLLSQVGFDGRMRYLSTVKAGQSGVTLESPLGCQSGHPWTPPPLVERKVESKGLAASQPDLMQMQESKTGEKTTEPNTKPACEARNQDPPIQFSQHPPPRILPPETDEQIRHHIEGQQDADCAGLNCEEGKGQRKPRKKRVATPPAPADPRFKGLIACFGEAFKERFGTNYTFQGVKDAVAIKRLLASQPDLTVEAIMGTIRVGWIGKDAWLRGACSTIAGAASQWNRLVTLKRPENPNPDLVW